MSWAYGGFMDATGPTHPPSLATTLPTPRPCWVAGRPETSSQTSVVRHPFDGSEIATVSVPAGEQIERAVAAAAEVSRSFRSSPAHLRAAALDHVSRSLDARLDEVAEQITAENGKPLKWAVLEAKRAVSTFRFAAEEARRFTGSLQRLDTDPTAE